MLCSLCDFGMHEACFHTAQADPQKALDTLVINAGTWVDEMLLPWLEDHWQRENCFNVSTIERICNELSKLEGAQRVAAAELFAQASKVLGGLVRTAQSTND